MPRLSMVATASQTRKTKASTAQFLQDMSLITTSESVMTRISEDIARKGII
jgi:hypothetical protein